ncbi:unnamed protein product [Merluccius merluccius]
MKRKSAGGSSPYPETLWSGQRMEKPSVLPLVVVVVVVVEVVDLGQGSLELFARDDVGKQPEGPRCADGMSSAVPHVMTTSEKYTGERQRCSRLAAGHLLICGGGGEGEQSPLSSAGPELISADGERHRIYSASAPLWPALTQIHPQSH